jgi:phospholipid-binding lipoprotein MlaA
VAKGYRALPMPIRRGTGNAVDNLRSLLTLANNLLQGNLSGAGNTAGRFAINTTVGILGIFDPAKNVFGLKDQGKEDFGQTLGVWGFSEGPYIMLPIFGPSNIRVTGLNRVSTPLPIVSLIFDGPKIGNII